MTRLQYYPLVHVEDNHEVLRREPARMRICLDLDLGRSNDAGPGQSRRSGTFRHVSSAVVLDFNIIDNDGAMLLFVIADTKDGTRSRASPDGDFDLFSFSNVGHNRSVATVYKENNSFREFQMQKKVHRLLNWTYRR